MFPAWTRFPKAPQEVDEQVERGRSLFFSSETLCSTCHAPPRFTTSEVPPVLYDVGTLLETSGQRLGQPLLGIDTPTLLGVWETAPYLHDGRASTLDEVLTTYNPDDRHGRTRQLSGAQIADLVAFLRSLDSHGAENSVLPEADACSIGYRPTPLPFALLLSFLLAIGRRTRRGRDR